MDAVNGIAALALQMVEIAARPLVDKNADTKAALPLNGMAALPLRMGIPEIAARPLSNLQKLDALFHLSQISDSL